jgi:ribosomal protein S25
MYFSVAAERLERHHYEMGSGSNPSIKPDLFSAQQPPDTSSPSASERIPPLSKDEPTGAASPSYALPTNLPSALSHLDDNQLERLLAAVIAERQARGGKKLSKSAESSRKQRTKEVAPPLAQGKLNAVRAAFKAGVTPSRIARQFGVSLSDVRRALASDGKK